MIRRSPLRRSRLRPVSEKGRARRAAESARVRDEGAAFRDAVRGRRCAVCGRTRAKGRVSAHHAVRQEVLRRLGREDILWAPRLAIPMHDEPCHRRHTDRHERLPLERVPADIVAFCREEGLYDELVKECGG